MGFFFPDSSECSRDVLNFHPDHDPSNNGWFYHPFKSSCSSDHTENMSSELDLQESSTIIETVATEECSQGNAKHFDAKTLS